MSEEEKAKELLYWIIDKYSTNFQTTEADMVKRMIEYKNADSLESKLERARGMGYFNIWIRPDGTVVITNGERVVAELPTLSEALDKALDDDRNNEEKEV